MKNIWHTSLWKITLQREENPNVIISGIHKIKGRTSVNILVSNYTNKHLPFHKGEYVRHLEPAVSDDSTIDQGETRQTNSVMLKKNDERESHTNIFDPPHHELSNNIQHDLDALLKEYESQFTKDETSIGTTPLTSMTIDTGASNTISQKPYPITMKYYQWVKEEIEKNYLQQGHLE